MATKQSQNEFFVILDRSRKFPLSQKHDTTIGREKMNDVVISDLEVSRQHAVIKWEKDRFFITDLKSQNGTIVNNKNVPKAHLSHGDMIRIGNHFLLVIVTTPDKIDTFLVMERKRMGKERTIKVSKSIQYTEKGFSGNVTSLPLVEAIQILHQSQKTGILRFSKGKNDQEAKEVYFVNGEIVHARLLDQTGIEAVFQLLKFDAGIFSYEDGVQAPEQTISKVTLWILMEAARVKDEENHNKNS